MTGSEKNAKAILELQDIIGELSDTYEITDDTRKAVNQAILALKAVEKIKTEVRNAKAEPSIVGADYTDGFIEGWNAATNLVNDCLNSQIGYI